MYYILSLQNYISVQWHYIYTQVTFWQREMGSHWVLTLLYLKNIPYWPEDDRLRSKHVAIIWPECICNIAVLIYNCVLTECNTLYKLSGWFLLRCNWNSNKCASVSLYCIERTISKALLTYCKNSLMMVPIECRNMYEKILGICCLYIPVHVNLVL